MNTEKELFFPPSTPALFIKLDQTCFFKSWKTTEIILIIEILYFQK